MFIKGQRYTRTAIHRELGGSIVACLPTQGGRIVAACLSPAFSPQAPRVMLCGKGPRNTELTERLVQQSGPLPVFLKCAPNAWAYQGLYRVAASHRAGPHFARYVQGSGRSVASVSQVVLFAPWDEPD